MHPEISLKVNGRTHRVRVAPDTPLLFVLRNDLGLKGAKTGCGQEQCGACKVIIDGYAVPTCRISARIAQGREITTVEGLAENGELHPVQQAFIDEQAIQCGYCTPGLIVAAKALLGRKPNPTDDEIRSELKLNLCRCGVHDRVVRAVKRAAGNPAQSPPYETVTSDDERPEPVPVVSFEDLPFSLQRTPDLDTWVRINEDGTISLSTGKVELGQGITTAIALIGAEELDVSVDRIRVVTADSAHSPDEGLTVGSMSLQMSGNAIRYAAADARHHLLSIAYEELEAPMERLTVNDGTITDPVTGRSVTYWELFGGKRFGRQVSGAVQPKRAEAYSQVGRPVMRLDLLGKVTGELPFIIDVTLPDMVYGRVVRPPHYQARLVSVDEESASRMSGVLKVVRDGSFLGVIAEREEQATGAMKALRSSAAWEGETNFPPQESLFDHLISQKAQSFLIVDGTPVEEAVPPIETPSGADQTLSAEYHRPYHMHASLGPSAAVAQMVDGKLTVYIHSQGVFPIRETIAGVLGMNVEDIHTIHVDGPGCYGHNGADDAALDAALLARAFPGRPVLLKWTRADENGWEPYGPATAVRMQASLSPEGEVINWNHDVYGYPHLGRGRPSPESSGLLAAWHLARPFAQPPYQPTMGNSSGVHRNADPLYAFTRKRVVKHFVPDTPLRVSAMRGLGYYANVFAIESFMDELAHVVGADPVTFRLRHLEDERAKAVIQAAADKAGWQGGKKIGGNGRGQGIAFARYNNRQCYLAIVVELNVDRESGQIRLERAIIAADAGQIVNPDGLSNQLEGGFVQAASWTLKEKVMFDSFGIISLDWNSYPILTFPEAPVVETVLLNRPDHPYLGSGEGAQGPAGAAIANAIYDAVGVRMRQIPFTPEQVKAAL